MKQGAATGRLIISTGALLMACAGCSGGHNQFELQGTITFRGAPVPKGRVDFMPDVRKNNDGPSSYATIERGRFDTNHSGRGAIAGPHIVRIQGFDGVPAAIEGAENGRSLFDPYETAVEISRDQQQYNFAVP
jgi:hypothetical protein